MSGPIFVDSFVGGLSELRRGKRTPHNALLVLAEDPRVSCFERGERWLESLLSGLVGLGLVVEEKGVAYPWCKFHVTDKGRDLIAKASGAITDRERLDWLQKAADTGKVELTRIIGGAGHEIGDQSSMTIAVAGGSLRDAIDAAMAKEGA